MQKKTNHVIHARVISRTAFAIIFAGCSLLSGCTGVKYLKEGESFYGGAIIKFHTQEKIGRKKILRKELETYITPKPNSKVLSMQPDI